MSVFGLFRDFLCLLVILIDFGWKMGVNSNFEFRFDVEQRADRLYPLATGYKAQAGKASLISVQGAPQQQQP